MTTIPFSSQRGPNSGPVVEWLTEQGIAHHFIQGNIGLVIRRADGEETYSTSADFLQVGEVEAAKLFLRFPELQDLAVAG